MKADYPENAVGTLGVTMRPEHFLGFLNGCILLEFLRPEPDTRDLIRMLQDREGFIQDQRDADEPTGLPIAPVFWTDEIGGYDDADELIACMDMAVPFALHSSVEPHRRWVARVPLGDGDWEARDFPTKAAAQQYLDEVAEEGRKQRQEAVEQAWMHVSNGEHSQAENLCEEFGLDYSYDPVTGQTTIDGEVGPDADGGTVPVEATREPAQKTIDEQIVAALAGGSPFRASNICFAKGIKHQWFGSHFGFNGRVFVHRMPAGWVEVFTEAAAASPLESEDAFHPHPAAEREDDGA